MPRTLRPRPVWLGLSFALAAGLALAAPALAVDDGWYAGHGTVLFDLGGTNRDSAQAMTVLADGRILLVGTVAHSGYTTAAVLRLLPNGAPDPSFGGGTGRVVNPCNLFVPSSASAVHFLNDNQEILIAGSLLFGGSGDFLVWRLIFNGDCDTTFGDFGTKVVPFDNGGDDLDEAAAMAVDSQGRIVVVGTADFPDADSDFGVARLTPSGDLDNSFAGDGTTTVAIDVAGFDADFGRAVAIDRQDRILVGGMAWNRDNGANNEFALARLLEDGSPDGSFGDGGTLAWGYNGGGSNQEWVNGVAIWPDGEIVAAGELVTGPAGQEWIVLRIGPNGSPVYGVTHGSFGFGSPSEAKALLLQGDGKIVIAGYGQGATSWDFGVARLLRDGTPDPSFGFGSGISRFDFNLGPDIDVDVGNAIALDHDGRIVVAGSALYDESDTDFGWLRLESSFIFTDGFEGGTAAAWSPLPL